MEEEKPKEQKKHRKDKKQLDYFACYAMRALLPVYLKEDSSVVGPKAIMEDMARNCYFVAKIMLKESEKHTYEEND